MSGLIIATLITVFLSAAIYGGVLWRMALPHERRMLFIMIPLTLPMSALAFYVVRQPIDNLVGHYLNESPFYPWVRPFYAPLTEEPAKLWPLLLSPIARAVRPDNAVPVALALGLGFGLGEIGLVAYIISGDPQLAGLPWYSLGGFISERFMVCLIHGLFTAMALCAWRRWPGWLLPGLLFGMLLHLLFNAPILIVGQGITEGAQAIGTTLVGLWVPLIWVLSILILTRLNHGDGPIGAALFGHATCPKCGETYPRPLLALNLGIKRLERCSKCHRWNVL
jgi:hypothetical protein